MYNRYLAAAEQTAPETSEPPQSSTFSGLGRTLNARLQGVRLDMDTMMLNNEKWRMKNGE